MTDYSQSGEQKYILKALGYSQREGEMMIGPPSGRLLDIGAWNAKTFSNSRALIELGWSAVLFEPSPGPLRGLVEEYGSNPRVEVVGLPVVGLPVSIAGGFMELRVTDDALSADAGNVEHLKKWEGYGFYGTMTTRAVSLLDIYRAWDGNTFDFVSIDTEGTSVDLFAQMISDYWRPRCVCVEHEERWEELRKAAEAGNYRLVSPPEGSINAILEHVK
jgi:FkbM family methyltransferase